MKKYLLMLFFLFPFVGLYAQHVLIKKPVKPKPETSASVKVATTTKKGVHKAKRRIIEPEMVYVEAEKQNYDALLLQRDKWVAVVYYLKAEQANGNNTVTEKLIKAQSLLNRINQKIYVSSKKLGY